MITVIDTIKADERWRGTPYYCSENYPTVGWGFKLGEQNAPLPKFVLPKHVGDVWLVENVGVLYGYLRALKWFADLSTVRQATILNMSYQMGYTGVLKFKRMIAAIIEGDYKKAADEILDSLLAKQTPRRAARMANQMRSNAFDEYYTKA